MPDRAHREADPWVCMAYAVLHPDTWHFAHTHGPRLLRQLRRRTRRVLRETRGGVRGHIDWPGTLKRRWAGDPTWVARGNESAFDQPENRLVIALCKRLLDWGADLREPLAGVEVLLIGEGSSQAAGARLSDVLRPLQRVFNDPRLCELKRHADPAWLSDERHREAARTSHQREYVTAEALAARFVRAEAPHPPPEELLLIGPGSILNTARALVRMRRAT